MLNTRAKMNYPHKRHERLLEPLFDDSMLLNQHQAHATSVHVAILVKRGQVLSMATNKIGSRSRGAAYSFVSIHAEKNCIRQLGDLSKLKGAEMYVVRIPPVGNQFSLERRFMKSKPCAGCQAFLEKCMREYGLRNVYFSDGNGCDAPSKCTIMSSDPEFRCKSSSSNARSETLTQSSSSSRQSSRQNSPSTTPKSSRSSSPAASEKSTESEKPARYTVKCVARPKLR